MTVGCVHKESCFLKNSVFKYWKSLTACPYWKFQVSILENFQHHSAFDFAVFTYIKLGLDSFVHNTNWDFELCVLEQYSSTGHKSLREAVKIKYTAPCSILLVLIYRRAIVLGRTSPLINHAHVITIDLLHMYHLSGLQVPAVHFKTMNQRSTSGYCNILLNYQVVCLQLLCIHMCDRCVSRFIQMIWYKTKMRNMYSQANNDFEC